MIGIGFVVVGVVEFEGVGDGNGWFGEVGMRMVGVRGGGAVWFGRWS